MARRNLPPLKINRQYYFSVGKTLLSAIACDTEQARERLIADLTASNAKPETIEALRTTEPTIYDLHDTVAIYD